MRPSLAAVLIAGLLASEEARGQEPDVHWPSFRGRGARGVAEGHRTPVAWDGDGSDGRVLWKTAIPGLGLSSPVVWGGKLFITTAISGSGKDDLRVGLYGDIEPVEDDTKHAFKVLCLDTATGKVLWERTAHEGVPKVKRHTKSSHASCTMAVDAGRAAAFFGSEGLYCYDFDGKLLWKKDLGVLDSGYFRVPAAQWGFASSPVIHDGKVFVQCDVQKGGFLAAFDLADGREIWRTPRVDVPTWSTPTVHDGALIVNGWKHIGGYDARTGKEVWRLKGGGDIPVPTPVVAHGLIFITNAHGALAPLYAVRLGAAGELAPPTPDQPGEHLAWFHPREGAYMQTPLVYGEHLYVCRDNGTLACFEAKTGRKLYQERLASGSGFTASGVAADGKLYYASEPGKVYVVKAGQEFKLLASNAMGDLCMATPAISEGTLFIRTRGHVVAVR